MKTIILHITIAIVSLFCFASCNEENSPTGVGAKSDIDFTNSLSPEELFKLSGCIVVKFSDIRYKEMVLLRSFSDIDANAYYLPQNNFKSAFIPYFDKREHYIHLFDDYYAVDWAFMHTCCVFGDNNLMTTKEIIEAVNVRKELTIQDIKDQLQSQTSSFAKDMKNLVALETIWNDFTYDELYNQYQNKVVSLTGDLEYSSNPFEYVQFVFISDLFTQADIDTELNYELYKKYSNNHLMALTPLNTDCGFWYRNNIDNSLSLNDNNLLRYYNYFDFETNGVPNDYKIIQETIISDIIDLVGSGKASLPQSLIK